MDREVEVVLDRGHFEGDDWVSDPVGADRLLEPAVRLAASEGTLARGRARLPFGEGVARVHREGCAPASVPYRVGAENTVLLPYPGCAPPDAPEAGGTRLGRAEVTAAEVHRVQALGLLPAVPAPEPGAEDGPARWVTQAEAATWCAWWGGRLPTAAELAAAGPVTGEPVLDPARDRLGDGPLAVDERRRAGWAPPVGPAGHLDLVGNVAEWTAGGDVAGGSWVDRDASPRRVPPTARTDTIGFRCAWPD